MVRECRSGGSPVPGCEVLHGEVAERLRAVDELAPRRRLQKGYESFGKLLRLPRRDHDARTAQGLPDPHVGGDYCRSGQHRLDDGIGKASETLAITTTSASRNACHGAAVCPQKRTVF